MSLFSFLKSKVCKDIISLNSFISENNRRLFNENNKLQEQINKMIKENEEAKYWNNKFPKEELTYLAKEDNIKIRYDIRNFIYTNSYILQNIYSDIYDKDYDIMALNALIWVGKNIKYVGDFQNQKVIEYWQDPELTLQLKKGDCEDGAILIASLLRCFGVPAYRVKVCCSWVQDPNNLGKDIGHAYCIYLDNSSKWRILDWCYYFGESIENFNKLQHKENSKYKEIWWTFNDEFVWSADKDLE